MVSDHKWTSIEVNGMRETLLIWLLSAAVIGAAQVVRPQAPESLLRAAGLPPMSFVELLVEAGIPAGLEIRESDLRATAAGGEATGWKKSVPLQELIEAFNERHVDYTAVLVDGVVMIRPTRMRADYLDQTSRVSSVAQKGLMPIIKSLFVPLDESLGLSGGQVSSRLGPVGVAIDRGDPVQLSMDLAGATVIEWLNRIGTQVPGHAWLVVTSNASNGSQIVSIGWVHRHKTTSQIAIGRR